MKLNKHVFQFSVWFVAPIYITRYSVVFLARDVETEYVRVVFHHKKPRAAYCIMSPIKLLRAIQMVIAMSMMMQQQQIENT